MKVLITGPGGFLGKYVVDEIDTVHPNITPILLSNATDSRFKTISPCGYAFDGTYLCNNGCDDVEAVIHMGAFTPKSSSSANDISGATSNITSTLALLRSDLPSLRTFIYLSTLDVYGAAPIPISESSLCIPQTLYGMSKLYCEKMAEAYCKEKDISCQILRIGHVYGAGEEKYRKVMPVMIENAIKGEPLKIYGSGNTLRSFIYARDVAKAIIASLSLTSSNIVNVVGDSAVTITELTELIINLSHSKSSIQYLPTQNAEHDITFDASHMHDTLPIMLTPLQDGLLNEIEYMRAKLA